MKIQSAEATVLVVDDEDLIRKALRRTLRRNGYNMVEASSVPEAIRLLDSRVCAIDAIILDLRMPGPSGHDLLAELRRRDLWIPAIMVSGDASLDDAVSAFRTGKVVDFLSKPYASTDLLKALERALHGDPKGPAQRGAEAPRPSLPLTPIVRQDQSSPSTKIIREVRERLRAGRLSLPRAPIALEALAAAVRDPGVGDEEIADAIRIDAALAIRVVRLAEGLGRPKAGQRPAQADDLVRAVERLGPRRVLTLAAALTKERAHRAFQLQEVDVLSRRLDRRTRRVAQAVELLAQVAGRECPIEDALEVQVADLGEPLLLHLVEGALLDGASTPDFRRLRKDLADNHAAFGAAVAERWLLGDRLRTLIQHHHHPQPAEERMLATKPKLRDRIFLQALGEHAVRHAMASPIPHAQGPSEAECRAILGLSRGAYGAAINRLRGRLAKARAAA